MIGTGNTTMGYCSKGERLGSTQIQQGKVEIYSHGVEVGQSMDGELLGG